MDIINKNKYSGKISETELNELERRLKQEIMETHWEWLEMTINEFKSTTESYLDDLIEYEEYEELECASELADFIIESAWDNLAP